MEPCGRESKEKSEGRSSQLLHSLSSISEETHSLLITHSGAVVDLLPHVVTDVLQLVLRDLLHGPHHVRDGLGAIEGTATGL